MSGARAVARLVPVDAGTKPGSAFAVSPRLALTASHCVANRKGARVELCFGDGSPVGASTLEASETDDIALLALDDPLPPDFEPIRLVEAPSGLEQRAFRLEGFGVDRPPGSGVHAVDGHVVTAGARLFDSPAVQLFSPQMAADEDPHESAGVRFWSFSERSSVRPLTRRLASRGGA